MTDMDVMPLEVNHLPHFLRVPRTKRGIKLRIGQDASVCTFRLRIFWWNLCNICSYRPNI